MADSREDSAIHDDHDSEVQQEKYDIYRHRILAASEEDIGFESEGVIREGGHQV